MTVSSRAALSRAAALSLAASALVLGSLAVAAPASAHDRLVSSDPAADATVAELPDELTLVYSGELIDADDGTAVEVRGPSGADLASDAPVVDGTDVTVPVDDPGEAGVYTVTWRVVSNDGHPIDGTFEFTSEGESDDAASGDGASDESPSASPSDSDESAAEGDEPTESESAAPAPADDAAGVSPVWILVGVGALVVVAGVVVAAVVVSRRGSGSDDDGRPEPDDDDR